MGGSEVARQCDGRGGFLPGEMDCASKGRICVDGVGCAVCRPNARRCNPDNPQQTQQCSADGNEWIDGIVCDENAGRTCNNGACEDRCNSGENTYLGCDYWAVITANSQLDTVFNFAVVLANPQRYPVRATISGGALGAPITRTLMPGAVETVQLPRVPELIQNGRGDPVTGCGGRPCIASSVLQPGGAYHIETNGPIAVYQFNPLHYRVGGQYSYTNDASLLLPTRVLTNHYIVSARENWDARNRFGQVVATLGGFIAIVPVSGETETRVDVRLTAAISGGPGVTPSGPGPRTFMVPRGGVLQLVAAQSGQDLTGTVIQSSGPVAVFTGHDCTFVPADRPACDHLEEQLFPSATWGRRYAVTQLRDRGPTERHRVRIVSQRAGLTLTWDGIAPPPACNRTLDLGQFCEFETTASFQVTGSQPFLVTQFMIGQGDLLPQCASKTPPEVPECMGDPAMVTEVPIDQFRQSYDFLVPETYTRSFMNVVAPTGAQIVLDGAPLSGRPEPVGRGFEVYFIPMRPGRHHIESMRPDDRFGIKVYGVAPYTSYMYPGGLDLAPISPPG